MKKLLIKLFAAFGFSVKFTNLKATNRYKASSKKPDLDLYQSPTGNYYLPAALKNDVVANAIKKGLLFDEEIIEVAKHYIKPNTSFLDVGANYGQMSVVLSKHVKSLGNGTIFSFEAEPFVAEILKENITANKCNNVKVVTGAVYHTSNIKLIFPEPDFKRFDAYGSYGIDPTAKTGRTVETITIDSLQINEHISFIKIDIQGCDLFAMQGAKETILKNKPAIIFEYEEQFQEEFQTSFNDYVDFVISINYRFVKTYMDINYLIVPN